MSTSMWRFLVCMLDKIGLQKAPRKHFIINKIYREYNARNFELANAAIVCDQNNLNPEFLSKKVLELINNSNKREKLSKNIKSFGMPNASSNIADFAEEVIG